MRFSNLLTPLGYYDEWNLNSPELDLPDDDLYALCDSWVIDLEQST